MKLIVETCRGVREIADKQYWHLVPSDGMSAQIFRNNVRVGKGALLSVSAGITVEPEIWNAQTPYSMVRINDEKERIFEQTRQAEFPACPPRMKTLYVFDTLDLVERASEEWFQNERKIIHGCRVISGAVTHKADTVWLNSTEDQWLVNSRKYWNGTMSDNPFPEVLVHGAIYFPDWEEWVNA